MTELERRTAYRAKCDKARLDAARAMLAALEAVTVNIRPATGSIHEDSWADRYQRYLSAMKGAEAAITQAKAAGIK